MDSWDLACSGVRYLITDTESDIHLKYFFITVRQTQPMENLSLALALLTLFPPTLYSLLSSRLCLKAKVIRCVNIS